MYRRRRSTPFKKNRSFLRNRRSSRFARRSPNFAPTRGSEVTIIDEKQKYYTVTQQDIKGSNIDHVPLTFDWNANWFPSEFPDIQDPMKKAKFDAYYRKKLKRISVYLKDVAVNFEPSNNNVGYMGTKLKYYSSPYGAADPENINTNTCNKFWKSVTFRSGQVKKIIKLWTIHPNCRNWASYTYDTMADFGDTINTRLVEMNSDRWQTLVGDKPIATHIAFIPEAMTTDGSAKFMIRFQLCISTTWSLAAKKNQAFLVPSSVSRPLMERLNIQDSPPNKVRRMDSDNEDSDII